jgi:hypothetical protein
VFCVYNTSLHITLSALPATDTLNADMFDVSWNDPTRELVGERRARKELENRKKEEIGSSSASVSTHRSSSSVGGEKWTAPEKSTGFFGSIRLKKGTTSNKNGNGGSSGFKGSDPESSRTPLPSLPTTSTVTTTPSSSTASDDRPPSSMAPLDGGYLLEHLGSPWENPQSFVAKGERGEVPCLETR